jgi:protein gp37
MNRTKIEWVKNPDGSQGYTWNPITGCLNHVNGLCKGGGFPCYAYKLAHGRLKQRYLANHQWTTCEVVHIIPALLDPFYPRFWEERLKDIERPPYPFSAWECNAPNTFERMISMPPNLHAKHKKVGIFSCDMGDLFGIGIPEEWTRRVLDAIKVNSVDRFYLLTKQPQNLMKFSPFPENVYIGITVTNVYAWAMAPEYLSQIEASVRFVSVEPMLEQLSLDVIQRDHRHWVDWLIIGAQTKPYKPPEIAWVREIVEAADKAGIPVFLKDNLQPLFKDLLPWWALDKNRELYRQEMPKIK